MTENFLKFPLFYPANNEIQNGKIWNYLYIVFHYPIFMYNWSYIYVLHIWRIYELFKGKLIPFRSAFFIRQKKMSQKADGILLKILLSWIASEFTTSQICVYVYYKKMSKIKGGNKTILLSRSLLTYFGQK